MSFSDMWGQSWLGPCPLFAPSLREFGLILAIHIIPTLPMSHCKYNEWSCKVEIWVQHPQPSPHIGFWVVGWDNFRSTTLHFTPRWCMFGLIQEYHSISTLPTYHYKNNEWSENVQIGIWALKWSPRHVFQWYVGSELAWPLSTFCTKLAWVWTDSGNSHHPNPSNVSL